MTVWSWTILLLSQGASAGFLVSLPDGDAVGSHKAERSQSFAHSSLAGVHRHIVPHHAGEGDNSTAFLSQSVRRRAPEKGKSVPKGCGLNPDDPKRPRPGCDAVYCEAISTEKDCQTAKEHGYECSWGGDDTCRTPPHLQKVPRGDTERGSSHDFLPDIEGPDTTPKDCGLNHDDPESPIPGCKSVICEDIKTEKECRAAKDHGYECNWAGDDTCRTPPHLQKAPRHTERGRDDDTWLAGSIRILARLILFAAVVSVIGLVLACIIQGPIALRRSLGV